MSFHPALNGADSVSGKEQSCIAQLSNYTHLTEEPGKGESFFCEGAKKTGRLMATRRPGFPE